MNFSLKPHPLVAHWVPGFTFLTLIWLSRHGWNFGVLAPTGPQAALYTLILAVAAFVTGQVFDALRDSLIERLFDKHKKLKWEKIVHADSGKVNRFEDYYYTWYVLDWNLAISLFAFLVTFLLSWLTGWPANIRCHIGVFVVVFARIALFIINAILLRKEIIDLIKDWEPK